MKLASKLIAALGVLFFSSFSTSADVTSLNPLELELLSILNSCRQNMCLPEIQRTFQTSNTRSKPLLKSLDNAIEVSLIQFSAMQNRLEHLSAIQELLALEPEDFDDTDIPGVDFLGNPLTSVDTGDIWRFRLRFLARLGKAFDRGGDLSSAASAFDRAASMSYGFCNNWNANSRSHNTHNYSNPQLILWDHLIDVGALSRAKQLLFSMPSDCHVHQRQYAVELAAEFLKSGNTVSMAAIALVIPEQDQPQFFDDVVTWSSRPRSYD